MHRLRFDQHAVALALGAALPALAAALVLLWTGDYSAKVQWTVTTLLAAVAAACLVSLRVHVVTPLQTLANLIAAMREDDFSIRGRTVSAGDPLGDVMTEVNALAETLHEQRLGAVEATALLRTVMEQIDVAVLAFDPAQRLRLVNRTGERLLGRAAEQLLGTIGRGAGRDRLVRRGAAHRRSRRARRRRPVGSAPHDLPPRRPAATTCWCSPT